MWEELSDSGILGTGALYKEHENRDQQTELLGRFAMGDLAAFEILFRQFQNDVYRWIVRIVRDSAAAEDLTLETFWRVYRARARFDPRRSFGAWARRIATNLALDHLKSARSEFTLPEPPSRGPTIDPVLQQEIRQRVEYALNQLPAKLRIVAILALVEEEPYERIAEALGLSVGAVKSRVFRAVRKLREELKRLGVEP
jgi:RNA polymerase sigma factor (sigma-70 family)